jgi:hypothetical protein
MSILPTTSWWTNKRLFWFTFWAWLFGLVFVFGESQKTYDPNAIYKVTTYRAYSGGRRSQVGDPGIESGDALIQKEITRISVIRVLGFLAIGAAITGIIVIFGRVSNGRPVFRDAFHK